MKNYDIIQARKFTCKDFRVQYFNETAFCDSKTGRLRKIADFCCRVFINFTLKVFTQKKHGKG